MAKDTDIYETLVVTEKLPGFLHFLRNLGIPEDQINEIRQNAEVRGNFQVLKIDLTNDPDLRSKLNEKQLNFV